MLYFNIVNKAFNVKDYDGWFGISCIRLCACLMLEIRNQEPHDNMLYGFVIAIGILNWLTLWPRAESKDGFVIQSFVVICFLNKRFISDICKTITLTLACDNWDALQHVPPEFPISYALRSDVYEIFAQCLWIDSNMCALFNARIHISAMYRIYYLKKKHLRWVPRMVICVSM